MEKRHKITTLEGKVVMIDYFLDAGSKKSYFAIRKLDDGNSEMYIKKGRRYELHMH
jgi:hypothetical protein